MESKQGAGAGLTGRPGCDGGSRGCWLRGGCHREPHCELASADGCTQSAARPAASPPAAAERGPVWVGGCGWARPVGAGSVAGARFGRAGVGRGSILQQEGSGWGQCPERWHHPEEEDGEGLRPNKGLWTGRCPRCCPVLPSCGLSFMARGVHWDGDTLGIVWWESARAATVQSWGGLRGRMRILGYMCPSSPITRQDVKVLLCHQSSYPWGR